MSKIHNILIPILCAKGNLALWHALVTVLLVELNNVPNVG
jgi:hypothetical protein